MPGTEDKLPDLTGFDTWSDETILRTILAGQRRALDAVERALPAIAQAADAVAARIGAGGKLYYAGAGTSIRVAVQDGSELHSTFGMPPEQIVYLIAGGNNAVFETLADAEDSRSAGEAAAQACTKEDVLIAVAASGRTPFTIGAAHAARRNGATVITIANNAGSALAQEADIAVVLESGPEVVSGSTRMAAGTAQKAALNMISTLAHTRLGAVHDGYMVNVLSANSKLQARAQRIVMAIAGVDEAQARTALATSDGEIKTAVLLCKGVTEVTEARALLTEAKGSLRKALERLPLK